MAKRFDTLRAQMSPQRRRRARERARAMLAEMPLKELREARQVTQEGLARSLDARQSGISKLESRADMRLSTLRNYVAAIGGELHLIARFPEGDVRIRLRKSDS